MQRIRGLGSYADIRSKWWSADVRLPSHASTLCDDAACLVGRASIYRRLLVGKRGPRTYLQWSDLFDLLPPQSGWHWTGARDATVLRRVPCDLGRHAVSQEARTDT